jgi:hypothetical protein
VGDRERLDRAGWLQAAGALCSCAGLGCARMQGAQPRVVRKADEQ